MKERLRSESSLQPLLAQFVPLDVDLETDEGQNWSRRFPADGNAIPRIYVIRADGTAMYAKSGSLPGSELPQMLKSVRPQAGAALSNKQLEQIAKAVDVATKSLADSDVEKAVLAIAPAAGSGSYAAAAVEADKLANQLLEKAKQGLTEAEQKLASDSDALTGAIQLSEIARVYRIFTPLKPDLAEAHRKWNKDPGKRVLLAQGSMIDKANQLVGQNQNRRAIEAFQLVATKHPSTGAAELALAKIQELGAQPAASSVAATPAAAAKAADKSGSADEKVAASNLRLARTFAKSKPDKAREYAQKVIDAVPGSDLAKEAEKLIAEL